MSEFSLGGIYVAEETMDRSVEDAHRWADDRRLRRQVKAEREESSRFYFRLMASLGRRFTSWGEQLQERYSSPDSASMAQSV